MIDPTILLLAAGCATAWLGIAEEIPLGRADEPKPTTNRMEPLKDGETYQRRHPPTEPIATCRLCGAVVSVALFDKRLFPHRVRLDPQEPLCPDPGTYASDVAKWQERQERLGLRP